MDTPTLVMIAWPSSCSTLFGGVFGACRLIAGRCAGHKALTKSNTAAAFAPFLVALVLFAAISHYGAPTIITWVSTSPDKIDPHFHGVTGVNSQGRGHHRHGYGPGWCPTTIQVGTIQYSRCLAAISITSIRLLRCEADRFVVGPHWWGEDGKQDTDFVLLKNSLGYRR